MRVLIRYFHRPRSVGVNNTADANADSDSGASLNSTNTNENENSNSVTLNWVEEGNNKTYIIIGACILVRWISPLLSEAPRPKLTFPFLHLAGSRSSRQ